MNQWVKQADETENAYVAMANLISSLKVPVTNRSIKKCTQCHYSSPSLLSVSDCLEQWGIQSSPVRISADQISLVTTPAIAHVQKDEGKEAEFVVLLSAENEIVYVDGSAGEIQTSLDKFAEISSGIFLLPASANAVGEDDYASNTTRDKTRQLAKEIRLSCLLGLPIVLLLAALAQSFLLAAFAIATKSAGLFLSEILKRIQKGESEGIAKWACDTNSGGGCQSVLSSTYAKPFDLFTLSEIGICYFASCLIALGISFVVGLTEPVSVAVLLISGLALPGSIHLIYVQRYKLQQWCKLCMIVHAVLFVELIVGLIVIFVLGYSFPDIQAWGLVLLSIIATFALLLALRDDQLDDDKTDKYEIQFKKIATNPNHLQIFLEPIGDLPESLPRIVKRGANAKNHIQIYSQANCFACQLTHHEFDKFLPSIAERVNVEIVLLSKIAGVRREMARRVYGIAKHRSSEEAYDAYMDWMGNEKLELEQMAQWEAKLELNESELLCDEELAQVQESAEGLEIEFTPVVTVNGQRVDEQINGIEAARLIGRGIRKQKN